MELENNDLQQLVTWIQKIPEFQSQSGRQTLFTGAMMGMPRCDALMGQLNFEGASQEAAVKLLKGLLDFGQVAPGREAIGVFLGSLRGQVGLDREAFINDLFTRYPFEIPQTNFPLFVSYAPADNALPCATLVGAVTTLLNTLGDPLNRALRVLNVDTTTTAPHDARIPENAKVMLVILSPGYLQSPQYKDEFQAFWQEAQKEGNPSARVVLIEFAPMETSSEPPDFARLTRHRFWIRENDTTRLTIGLPENDPARHEYFNRLDDLSGTLSRLLAGKPPAPVASGEGILLYLAEVTDDLDTRREELERYLNQRGIQVLPQTTYPRDDVATYQNAVNSDLKQCKFFVQLLSDIVGKRARNETRGFARLQYECAVQAKMPVLQWYSKGQGDAACTDPDHLALLQGTTVRVEPIEAFKEAIVKEALKAPTLPQVPLPSRAPLVFINYETVDQPLAQQMSSLLEQNGFAYSLRDQEEDITAYHEYLEENLMECDSIVFIHGKADARWVFKQAVECRKILWKRKNPLPEKAWVLCGVPPPPREKLPFHFPEINVFNLKDGLDEKEFHDFLLDLRDKLVQYWEQSASVEASK